MLQIYLICKAAIKHIFSIHIAIKFAYTTILETLFARNVLKNHNWV